MSPNLSATHTHTHGGFSIFLRISLSFSSLLRLDSIPDELPTSRHNSPVEIKRSNGGRTKSKDGNTTTKWNQKKKPVRVKSMRPFVIIHRQLAKIWLNSYPPRVLDHNSDQKTRKNVIGRLKAGSSPGRPKTAGRWIGIGGFLIRDDTHRDMGPNSIDGCKTNRSSKESWPPQLQHGQHP